MDRIEFAKRLNAVVIPDGTPNETIRGLMLPISNAIRQMMPERLFRYRAFDERTLGAFKDGIIYAVTADMFNDPYDTLVKYDIDEIEKSVNQLMSCDTLAQLKCWLAEGNDFPDVIKRSFPEGLGDGIRSKLLSIDDISVYNERIEEAKRMMISLIETYFPIISLASKKFSTIACFSEDVKSILMWSHYANSHTGFALEYNFRDTLEHPLEKGALYPVIHSDERVDVSGYIAWAFLHVILRINGVNPDISASIKSALFKSTVWAYEKEWRLIDPSPRLITDNAASAIPYYPVAVYYGQNMSMANKAQMHAIAQEKGIKEYEMYIDYSWPRYEMRYRPYMNDGTL